MNLVREWEGNHKQQKDRDHDEEKELKEKKISVKKGVFNLEGEEDEEEKAGEEWDEEYHFCLLFATTQGCLTY